MKRIYTYGSQPAKRNLYVHGHLELVLRLSTKVDGLRMIGKVADEAMLLLVDIRGTVEYLPRHVKAWSDMLSARRAATAECEKGLAGFQKAVKGGFFPDAAHSLAVPQNEYERLQEALANGRSIPQ